MGTIVLAVMSLFFISVAANAGLGDNQQEIENGKSQQRVLSIPNVLTNRSYTVKTVQSPASTINQYINNDGNVFAITWRGIATPDLHIILGKHFNEYLTEFRKHPIALGRKPFIVETSKIIVHQFGHMRDIRGLAYQVDIVPSGVNAETLQ